jgi:hypothetical protein
MPLPTTFECDCNCFAQKVRDLRMKEHDQVAAGSCFRRAPGRSFERPSLWTAGTALSQAKLLGAVLSKADKPSFREESPQWKKMLLVFCVTPAGGSQG